MRLSKTQIHNIVQGISPFIQNTKAELRLFGSRVDDHAKGGDIDLLLIVWGQEALKHMLDVKYRMLSHIKKYMEDRKIDITIALFAQIPLDPFLTSIFSTSIIVYEWK